MSCSVELSMKKFYNLGDRFCTVYQQCYKTSSETANLRDLLIFEAGRVQIVYLADT